MALSWNWRTSSALQRLFMTLLWLQATWLPRYHGYEFIIVKIVPLHCLDRPMWEGHLTACDFRTVQGFSNRCYEIEHD